MTHPRQALLQCVQDDELGEVEVLLRSFSKYPLQRRVSVYISSKLLPEKLVVDGVYASLLEPRTRSQEESSNRGTADLGNRFLRMKPTHHVVDIFQYVGEAADDEGELVFRDVDQTFLVVLCADFGVGVLVSNFNGKLKNQIRAR